MKILNTMYTLGEFLTHIENLPEQSNRGYYESPGGDIFSGGLSWSGGNTLEECIKLAYNGWPVGTAAATQRLTKLTSRVVEATSNQVLYQINYDTAGAAFDAGAVALGQPEAWGYMQPHESKRAVRIILNISASGGIVPEVLRTRGIAVTALVMLLQADGYPVTLDVGDFSTTFDVTYYDYVRVVAADGSPLDVDRMCFCLSHPGMLRQMFRTHFNEAKYARYDVWGHGAPNDSRIEELCGKADIILGGTHLKQVERWEDGGEQWVLDTFNSQTKGYGEAND